MATRPLDETTVRRVLAEFPGIKAEHKEGYMVLPWHGLGPAGVSEAFALRLHELTGCLIADRRNGRLIEPEALAGKKRAANGLAGTSPGSGFSWGVEIRVESEGFRNR